MAEVVRMPRMSDTMEEGVIVAWLKQEGDEVESGETLAEVETDKATMELDSYSDGILLHIAVKEGPVPINGVIAVIGEKGEDWKAAIEAAGGDVGASTAAEPTPEPAVQTATSTPAPLAVAEAASDGGRLKASPLAKSMAREAGLDLRTLKGSGDQGRIVKKDVEAALGGARPISTPSVAPPPTSQPVVSTPPAAAPATSAASTSSDKPAVQPFAFSGSDSSKAETVSQMRKAIAKSVVTNKFSAPHFYLTINMDMEKAIAARKQMNEIAPTKISFNDLVIKAAAAALQQHPYINASWVDPNQINFHQHIHVGVAVATPDGLLLPVIRNANMKTLSQINVEVKEKAGLARIKKLPLEDMQGSTFMISNLGMFGIEEFTAIISQPNACSLAVGTIVDTPVVKDGEVVPGKMMKVTLSCDHRVVDGAIGAQFLQTFKAIMEDPIRMLV